MNYQHIYHAGNSADVIKHAVLFSVLNSLKKKETPFCFIDTHAGSGSYDLNSTQAMKTGEAKQSGGVLDLLKHQNQNKDKNNKNTESLPEFISVYLTYVNGLLSQNNIYPGSPWIADALSRPQDQLILNELHPEACRLLKRLFKARTNVAIHQRDAYEFLPAVLPPAKSFNIKRACILIDPPYERTDEAHAVAHALALALEKFPQGVYLIWEPITSKKPVWRPTPKMASILKKHPNYKNMDFLTKNSEGLEGLIGSHLLILNPPYGAMV